VLDFDGSRKVRRRDAAMAGAVLFVGIVLFALPPSYQEPVRAGLRGTVLSPFLAAQVQVAERRGRMADVSRIRSQRDSLAALAAAQSALAEENRRLRSLLGLTERTGASFVPTNVLWLGLGAAEGTFMLSSGRDDGVGIESPVIAPEGLLGVVRVVEAGRAQAIDWTHPEFRVGAMTAEGDAYGFIEPRRGRSREEDLLAFTGAPFHTDIQPGRRIVSSGRGGVFPRGVVIGTVLGIEEADTGWRKSYLVRPAVRPEAATQVLVGVGAPSRADMSELWQVTAPADTLVFPGDTIAVVSRAGGVGPR
jgi:rod shape-determining protein MreC